MLGIFPNEGGGKYQNNQEVAKNYNLDKWEKWGQQNRAPSTTEVCLTDFLTSANPSKGCYH